MIRTRSNHVLLGAVLLLTVAGRATAQEFRATVKGQIVDASHGALPGATVSVQNAVSIEIDRRHASRRRLCQSITAAR